MDVRLLKRSLAPAADQPHGRWWLASSLELCPVLRLASGCSIVTLKNGLWRPGLVWQHYLQAQQ